VRTVGTHYLAGIVGHRYKFTDGTHRYFWGDYQCQDYTYVGDYVHLFCRCKITKKNNPLQVLPLPPSTSSNNIIYFYFIKKNIVIYYVWIRCITCIFKIWFISYPQFFCSYPRFVCNL
jgi:hypothetical protein